MREPGVVPIHASMYQIIPLKTTLETHARDQFIAVYVTTVPSKLASNVLNIVRKILPHDGGFDLQHLRRFAKDADLPPHVRNSLIELQSSSQSPEDAGITSSVSTSLTPRLHVIIGSTSSISHSAVQSALDPLCHTHPCCLKTTLVPLLAPTSESQALRWTAHYWPTVYKKNNLFGPHPSLVARAQAEIQEDASLCMDLAARVAQQAEDEQIGMRIGAVVVRRECDQGRQDSRAEVVAVAGDARWNNCITTHDAAKGEGNVTAHAVMRAIAMVASSLRRRHEGFSSSSSMVTSDTTSEKPTIFNDNPLLPLEGTHLRQVAGEEAYLCQDLEIYCTHEPCVMCSMAIVHSRFGRIVFGRRMPRTGGMDAGREGLGLGLGLWWRKELNWSMLGWEYVLVDGAEDEGKDEEKKRREDAQRDSRVSEDVHA